MPKFIIACSWEREGQFEVSAASLEEAIAKVQDGVEPYDGFPEAGEDVDDSFNVVKSACYQLPEQEGN